MLQGTRPILPRETLSSSAVLRRSRLSVAPLYRIPMSKTPTSSFAVSTAALLAFRDAREWKQFHTPRQLAAALAIEAGELQQTMLWKTDAEIEGSLGNAAFMAEIGDEVADVLSFALLLAHDLGLDPAELIDAKLKKNGERYPVEKSRGRSTKYTKL
ncbi:MAG: hypothetical protein RLZZ326_3385 [Planctomycetota bacterium]